MCDVGGVVEVNCMMNAIAVYVIVGACVFGFVCVICWGVCCCYCYCCWFGLVYIDGNRNDGWFPNGRELMFITPTTAHPYTCACVHRPFPTLFAITVLLLLLLRLLLFGLLCCCCYLCGCSFLVLLVLLLLLGLLS